MYRAIPLLEEIRILLDWTVAKTSLDTFMWFKLEDAYSSLYFVKGDMTVRKMYYPAEHRWLSEKIGLVSNREGGMEVGRWALCVWCVWMV